MIVLATGNEGKAREFREILAELGTEIVSAKEVGVTEFPEETGHSYRENALIKAEHVAGQTDAFVLADDSGLEVDALDGAPGLYSARFGGDLSPGERVEYLLDKLRDIPQSERGARFVCSLVLVSPGGEVNSFEGVCKGEILFAPRGRGGFGYDPVFYSHDLEKGFAEATSEEKRRVSHRGRAAQELLRWAKRSSASSYSRFSANQQVS